MSDLELSWSMSFLYICVLRVFSHARYFDNEMRAAVARNLEGRGINLHPSTNLIEVLFSINHMPLIIDILQCLFTN